MNPKKFILYRGESRYEAQKTIMRELSKALKRLGHESIVIDLSRADKLIELEKAQKGRAPDAIIAINAIGAEHSLQGVPFIAMLVDHPMYHLHRLQCIQNTPFLYVICCDRSHVHFMETQKQVKATVSFRPLPGYSHIQTSSGGRKKGLFFFGSYEVTEEIEKRWEKYPQDLRSMINTAARMVEKQYPMAAHLAAKLVLKEGNEDYFMPLVLESETFARNALRYRCLKTLDDAGIPVEIYGEGWDTCMFSSHHIFEPLNYPEMLRMLSEVQHVLDISPFFPHGMHERVPSALVNGAHCLCGSSSYLREFYFDLPYVRYFQWEALEDLPLIARHFLVETEPVNIGNLPVSTLDHAKKTIEVLNRIKNLRV